MISVGEDEGLGKKGSGKGDGGGGGLLFWCRGSELVSDIIKFNINYCKI